MIAGDVLRLRSLKAITRDDAELRSEVTYAAPKGRDFLVVLLGAVEHGKTPEELVEYANETMERLGWIMPDSTPTEGEKK